MSIDTPAISVITIVKDNEQLLARAVESVLSQAFSNYEYIIVNDGSTDGTARLIDLFAKKDKRVMANHLEKNIGRAMARNNGLECTKGEFIFFLDSDDYLPEYAFQELLEVTDKYDADIVYGGIRCFDKDTETWLKKHYTDDIIDKERHNFQLDEHLPLVFNHTLGGRLFSRKMLLKNNIKFNGNRKNGEDVLFSFYTAYYAKRISMVPNICAYYYSIGNFLDTANEQKLFDARDNVKETIQFTLMNGSNPLKRMMQIKGATFAADLERAYRVYGEDKKDLIEYLSTLLPLVVNISDDVLTELPEYTRRFTLFLLSHQFDEALSEFESRRSVKKTFRTPPVSNSGDKKLSHKQRDNIDTSSIDGLKARVDRMKIENENLAKQLDMVYHSNSWRITAPLRIIAKYFR